MNLADLLLLALAAAVYPTLLAGVVIILAQPRPLRMLVAFLIGGMTISVVAGVAIGQAIESSGAVDKSNHATNPLVDIVVGLLSLLVAWGVWSGHFRGSIRWRRRAERPKGASWTDRVLSRGSQTTAFLAGVVLNLPGIWYLDALAGIAHAKPSTTVALLQILLFNVIMFALVEFPIVAYIVSPQRAGATVTSLSQWAHARSRAIVILIATAVGLRLLAKGVVNLVS